MLSIEEAAKRIYEIVVSEQPPIPTAKATPKLTGVKPLPVQEKPQAAERKVKAKVCAKCHKPKPADGIHFYRSKHTLDRLEGTCIECRVAAQVARDKARRAKERAEKATKKVEQKAAQERAKALASAPRLCPYCGDPTDTRPGRPCSKLECRAKYGRTHIGQLLDYKQCSLCGEWSLVLASMTDGCPVCGGCIGEVKP